MAETTERDRERDGDPRESDDSERDRPSRADKKLKRALEAFKEDIQERVRDLLRAKKASEQLCRSGALDNLELVRKYTDRLREADLEAIDMDERRSKAVDSLDAFVQRRRNRRRSRFLRELHDRARDRSLEVEKLSESPPAMYVEPFVVAPDFETGGVDIEYARRPIDQCELDPETVLEVRDRWADRLSEESAPPEEFFDRLKTAYELVRSARDRGPEERVELVDLLAPLGLLRSGPDEWRDPELDAAEGYPKYLLAFQLQRVRSEGLLQRGGTRIDLGTATGGSTRDKEDVVFIPSGPDDGQYFLSIRFVDESGD